MGSTLWSRVAIGKVWGRGRAGGNTHGPRPAASDACFDVILERHPSRGPRAGRHHDAARSRAPKCGSTDRNIGAISSLACGVSSSPRHETSCTPFRSALHCKPVCVLLKFNVELRFLQRSAWRNFATALAHVGSRTRAVKRRVRFRETARHRRGTPAAALRPRRGPPGSIVPPHALARASKPKILRDRSCPSHLRDPRRRPVTEPPDPSPRLSFRSLSTRTDSGRSCAPRRRRRPRAPPSTARSARKTRRRRRARRPPSAEDKTLLEHALCRVMFGLIEEASARAAAHVASSGANAKKGATDKSGEPSISGCWTSR